MTPTLLAFLALSVCAATGSLDVRPESSPSADASQARLNASCTSQAASLVDRGAALAEVLATAEATRAFEQALAADGTCALAHWGTALASVPWPGEGLERLAEMRGRQAIERARAVGPPTARERAYIDALAVLYDERGGPFGRRRLAYRNAMRALAEQYDDDNEARVFAALSELALSTLPGDEAATRAATLIEQRFGRAPTHTGAAHVLLMAWDTPSLAARAEAAAVAFERNAPELPTAVHAPVHVLQRLGRWEAAARADERAMALVGSSGLRGAVHGPPGRCFIPERLHMSYIASGQFRKAWTLASSLDAEAARLPPTDAELPELIRRAVSRMRVSMLVASRNWDAVRSLAPQSIHDDELDAFARGLASARLGWRTQEASLFSDARQSADRLEQLAHEGDAVTETTRRWLLVRAAIAGGQYERDEMTMMLRQAQRIEEELVNTGRADQPLIRVDELAGELRWQLQDAGHARLHYRDLLALAPRHAAALIGLARAEQALGQVEAARVAARQFLDVWTAADPDRPELAEARRLLEGPK
jgi:tetratricopeptide (TPR) repeat protein